MNYKHLFIVYDLATYAILVVMIYLNTPLSIIAVVVGIIKSGILLDKLRIIDLVYLKDYMNAAQLEFFRTKLQTLKEDILKHASETTEHLRESILVPDPADRATIEEEHALS